MDRVAAARAIDAFLIAIGRDPKIERELDGTGARVAAAFIDELCAGYAVDPDALVRGSVLAGSGGIVELARRRGDDDLSASSDGGRGERGDRLRAER